MTIDETKRCPYRLWRAQTDGPLKELKTTKLDLEARLETWIESDISGLVYGELDCGSDENRA
jgi:hypothetical protein